MSATKTKQRLASFRISRADSALVSHIVERALRTNPVWDRQDLHMNLVACHANGCPLNFAKLLDADEFNFWHDINGIERHINKVTGEIGGHFLPRFYQPAKAFK